MYRWKISKKQEDKGWMEICKKPTKNWNSYASILITKEWIIQGDKIVEVAVQNLQKTVDKKYDPKSMSNEEPDIVKIAKYYGGLGNCKALLRELEDCDL